MTRIGKVARLPESIREQINQRLRDGQPASKILPWLNQLAEVRQVVDESFAGKPITKNNLSSWRKGGYDEEQKRRRQTSRLKDMASHAFHLAKINGGKLADGALVFATLQFCELLEAQDGELDLEQLGKIIKTLASVRKVEIAQQRAKTGQGMLQCRKAAQRLAERKFKHQVKLERHGGPRRQKLRPTTMTYEELLDAALTRDPRDLPDDEGREFSTSVPLPDQIVDSSDNAPLSEAAASETVVTSECQPTPQTEAKPDATQEVATNPLPPKEETEYNPVKADQDRCRAKYRTAKYASLFSPKPWEKYTFFNGK